MQTPQRTDHWPASASLACNPQPPPLPPCRLDDAAWQHNRERMAKLMRFGSVPLGEGAGSLA